MSHRRFTVPALLLVVTVALTVGIAAPSSAQTVVRTFGAGANQAFTVPGGVTEIAVTATGAGGQQAPSGAVGGRGAMVSATLTVAPGQVLYVNVDTGGGAPGLSGTAVARIGGRGGGSSDVRTCSSTDPGCVLTGVAATDPRLVVAAGGGGSGGGHPNVTNTAPGGDAGQPGGSLPLGATGGDAGTATAGGAAGTPCTQLPGGPASPGGPGTGGKGGDGVQPTSWSAGGGGGGWFGGGGGGSCGNLLAGMRGPAAGGGGSSFVPSGGTTALAAGPAGLSITFVVPDLAFATDVTLPAGKHGVPYSASLQTTGGTGSPSFAVTGGTLPDGLTVSSTGGISGTPTEHGLFAFSVTATDPTPGVIPAVRQFDLVVVPPDLGFVTDAVLPGAQQGVPYATTLQTTGGGGPPTYAVSGGALPAGVELDPATGRLAGTPTVAGTSTFTVTATDAQPGVAPATRTFTISVAASPAPPTPTATPTSTPTPTPTPPTPRSCVGATATLIGTAGDDLLVGTASDDVIVGLGGDDIIRGLGGDDTICAGDGNDRVSGAAGADLLLGRQGDDTLRGLAGQDDVRGGDGGDQVAGGTAADDLSGGARNDVVRGGRGPDTLDGSAGSDTCAGGPGTDGASGCEVSSGIP